MSNWAPLSPARLDRAYESACSALLAERCADGYWVGELASSALATATAVSALSLVERAAAQGHDCQQSPNCQSPDADSPSQISNLKSQISNLTPEISQGLLWLADHQNPDGGWGDTTLSLSNISTSMLVRAAFQLAGAAQQYATVLERATAYVDRAGGTAAVVSRYGADRTFAVPILANCALAGQVDWSTVAPLPFELAALPHSWFRFLRLQVVSYALPALIAIGQLIHAKRPTANWLVRTIRNVAVAPTLRKLEAIQPSSGGFLEAIPLTSFVTMSLAALGRAEHSVVRKGVEFLRKTVRPDGSWPIDSNLSVWLTTLSVNALVQAGGALASLPDDEARRTRDWLLSQQRTEVHPYTHAAPGGWGWSHLSGSVPDLDDTAGAVLALANLPPSAESCDRARVGIRWLLDVQNGDGGWPTFCRGWGKLPFDRSGSDLTAHAVRAIEMWLFVAQHGFVNVSPECKGTLQRLVRPFNLALRDPFAVRMVRALRHGIEYLGRRQRADGSWIPLWFGHQHAPDEENPTFGTARVLAAFIKPFPSVWDTRYVDILEVWEKVKAGFEAMPWERGINWLLASQNPDGGWGAAPGIASSVEETALAVESLSKSIDSDWPIGKVLVAITQGVQWLIHRVESGDWKKPSPIGLYFAKLWYFEKLYPQIFTVAALGRARRVLAPHLVPTSAQAH